MQVHSGRQTIYLSLLACSQLTGALSHVLPIMISVMISKWVADALGPDGIYASWTALRRYPWLTPFEFRDNGEIASDVMTPADKLVVLHEGSPLAELGQYSFLSAVREFIGLTHMVRECVGHLEVSRLPRCARRDITRLCGAREAQDFHWFVLVILPSAHCPSPPRHRAYPLRERRGHSNGEFYWRARQRLSRLIAPLGRCHAVAEGSPIRTRGEHVP